MKVDLKVSTLEQTKPDSKRTMGNPNGLTKAIDLLYGSILDEDDFEGALTAISDFAGARGAFVLTFDRITGTAVNSNSVGLDPAVQSDYLHQYSAQDLRVQAGLARPVGSLMTEHKLVHQDTFESSELYRDFLKRHDVPHILALWTRKSPTHLSALALQRSGKQGRFLKSDEEQLAPLVPHLVRALQIREALREARAANAAYTEVFDRLPFGVVMLDWMRAPTEVSRAAEHLFRTSGVIQFRGGRVRAARVEDDNRLQRAICKVMTSEGNPESCGTTVTLRDRRGLRNLRVTVVPVPKPHPYMHRLPACMLLIFDSSGLPAPSIDMVMKSLQLTRAEARLARELCRGGSLREAAETLRLSVNTCKTQLKSIYARTGCRSHAELTKTLLIIGLAQSASAMGHPAPASAMSVGSSVP